MGAIRTFSQIIFVFFIAFSYASDKDEALASKFQELGVENTETPRSEKKVRLRKVFIIRTTGGRVAQGKKCMGRIKADEKFIQEMFKEEEFKKYFFGIEDSRKEEVSQECLDDCLKGGDSYSMIVDKDTDERVGIGCLNKYNGRYYFAVSIEKNKRRQGYATAVVKKYIEDIKNIKGGKSVEAWAMSENPAMQTLLERLNFVEKKVTDYDKAPKHKHFVFCG